MATYEEWLAETRAANLKTQETINAALRVTPGGTPATTTVTVGGPTTPSVPTARPTAAGETVDIFDLSYAGYYGDLAAVQSVGAEFGKPIGEATGTISTYERLTAPQQLQAALIAREENIR